REPVAGGPHYVDIARADRDALFENPYAFVQQRVDAALDDLLLAVLARLDSELLCARFQDRDRFRVVMTRAVARLVAVVAFARFLAEAARIVQREVGLVVG